MRISKYFSFLFLIFLSFQSFSQLEFAEDKAKWTFRVETGANCEATIIAEVNIAAHWHINSIVLPKGTFGLATGFNLDKSPNYQLVGAVKEPKPIQKHDDLADEDLSYHEGKVIFRQKIKILSKKDFVLKGTYSFQPCDENHCLTEYVGKFEVKVKGCETASSSALETENENTTAAVTTPTKKDDQPADSHSQNVKKNTTDKKTKTASTQDKNDIANMSVLTIFLLSFGSGFLALLTPCVFPMIPMTVSFFTKRSPTKAIGIKNAIIYGISIIVIYILLGVVVTAVFGADSLNNMSTNPTFNIIFFLILIVFAVSFMGAFEIRMPSKWVNKADSSADKGGLIGIFFMALALALVSFSCTGPIVGSLLVQAATTGGMAPIVGMFGFSLALALPFAIFAAFPGWMNSLPKSGGWLNTVKVVLGLLELALAFKFLSNADLAVQAHYLEREVFLAIWIAIFAVLAFYLFGWLQFPHDSKIEKLSVGRGLLGTFIFAFVLYMIPGLWGAPLKLISAFPPPLNYSESPFGVGNSSGGNTSGSETLEIVDGMELGPQNIYVFHDFDKAKAYADKVGKPLFVDFTGHNCVNCRKMEQSVWGEPGIIDKLKGDVVIASLHVDERIDLPKEEQITVELTPGRFKTLKTTGDKWMYKQIKDYQVTAQPYYVMLDKEGNTLSNGSADYQNHGNPEVFKKWLDEGLKAFKK
ncbi:thioredoxin family protein [Fluviicola sp.]|uniref:protein-disulfide reductase DsbD family protein n=1 Tax=Fluviicola sp. TaxID=1917219 RepID=UPI00261CBF83|nr:thioredoxin family protein [Fluviicola sp.]